MPLVSGQKRRHTSHVQHGRASQATRPSSAIRIPSFLVSRADGSALRVAASAPATRPWASLVWDIPTADGAVRYELWQDADDANAVAFRESFMPYLPLLGPTAEFTPHFYNIDGRAHGCTQLDCATQCINGCVARTLAQRRCEQTSPHPFFFVVVTTALRIPTGTCSRASAAQT